MLGWSMRRARGAEEARRRYAARRVGRRRRASGDGEDGWNQLAFRGVDDPLDAEFERLAVAWRPMFDAMEELK